jgi:hypothetical protein
MRRYGVVVMSGRQKGAWVFEKVQGLASTSEKNSRGSENVRVRGSLTSGHLIQDACTIECMHWKLKSIHMLLILSTKATALYVFKACLYPQP